MSANAPSSSKHMSVEDEAREKNKPFWAMSQELEEGEAVELARGGDGDYEQEDEDETTTTDGGDHTDGGNPTAQKEKKQRRDRTPQVLANVTDEFT